MTKDTLEAMQKRAEEYFANITVEEAEKEYEKITHEKFYKRWADKLNAMSSLDRDELIDKVIAKYSSDEYRDREFNLGYMPRESLFGILYEYAKIYGEQVPDNLEKEFIEDAWIVDGTFYISVTWGQGSVYTCYRIESRDKYNFIMDNISEILLETKGFKHSLIYGVDVWQKSVDGVNIEFSKYSNMPKRDWSCHIDNSDCDSIARVDVQTVDHANKLFELIDINYRL